MSPPPAKKLFQRVSSGAGTRGKWGGGGVDFENSTFFNYVKWGIFFCNLSRLVECYHLQVDINPFYKVTAVVTNKTSTIKMYETAKFK